MKKYLAILVCLSLVPLSSSVATYDSGLGLAFEPTVPGKVLLDEPHGKEVFTQLKHNDLREVVKFGPKVIKEISKDILMTIKSDPATFTGNENVDYYMDKDSFGNPHDIPKNRTTTKEIDGVKVQRYSKAISPIGPLGYKEIYENEVEAYEIGLDQNKKPLDGKDRRGNVILSATYEKIVELAPNLYSIDLMLFMNTEKYEHYKAEGYIFKLIRITVDNNPENRNPNIKKYIENKKIVNISTVTLNGIITEIPLSDTDFEIRVELATQKAIFRDRKHGIIKVVPVTGGSIDSRELQDPTKVNSLTLLLDQKKKEGAPFYPIKYKNFDLKDSVLVSRKHWVESFNTSERTFPAYYKGRPFIALIDKSIMKRNFDGSLKKYQIREDRSNKFVLVENPEDPKGRKIPVLDPNGKPFYPDGYRKMGFHYQITDKGLLRSFKSHGCLRLQDHDLYSLDAIVNAGPKTTTPIEVKMLLDDKSFDFESLDSIYKRAETYSKVLYSSRPSPDKVLCKNKSPYEVRHFTGRNSRNYHTIADSDCLTAIGDVTTHPLQQVVDSLTGKSNKDVETWVANIEHHSIRYRTDFINENSNYIPYAYNKIFIEDFTFSNYQVYIADLNENQKSQIGLVDTIKTCIETPLCTETADEAKDQYNAYVNGARLSIKRTASRNAKLSRLKHYPELKRVNPKHRFNKNAGPGEILNYVRSCNGESTDRAPQCWSMYTSLEKKGIKFR